jgi:hypothetical protein
MDVVIAPTAPPLSTALATLPINYQHSLSFAPGRFFLLRARRDESSARAFLGVELD